MPRIIPDRDWILRHATDIYNIPKILEKGIRSSKETGNSSFSVTDKVCTEGIQKRDISVVSMWGKANFTLRPDYVKKNIDQFRVHPYGCSYKEFLDFLRRKGVKPYKRSDVLLATNQVLSLKPVPVEGLEILVLPESIDSRRLELIAQEALKRGIKPILMGELPYAA